MTAPTTFTTAKPSLAAAILAGDFTGLPDHFTDEEWRREAQGALDTDDEAPLHRMIEEGREAERERERQWQRETGRYSLNDYLDGCGPHPLFGVML